MYSCLKAKRGVGEREREIEREKAPSVEWRKQDYSAKGVVYML